MHCLRSRRGGREPRNTKPSREEEENNLENRKKEFSRAQQEMTAEYRKELEKRAEAIKNALSGKGFFAGGRILRSFPEMKSRDYGAVLEELKKRLTGKREE